MGVGGRGFGLTTLNNCALVNLGLTDFQLNAFQPISLTVVS